MDLSRRTFLASSAAAAALPRTLPAVGKKAGPRQLGPGEVEIRLQVNGRARIVKVEPRATLLETLRWKMGLTGPKEVCDRGACGACTILIDNKPILACMTLAVETEGRQITTVEGLGTPEAPGRVASALIAHDAVQCGYCIPGFVMSLEGTLRRKPGASAQELRHALAGNLCRCGTYTKMFEAAARLAGEKVAAGHPELNAAACVETALGRVDGPEKITGRAIYSADAAPQGMLFAQHILCPYSQAMLLSADLDAVRRLPGVVEVQLDVGEEFEFSGSPAGWICAESPAALRDGITALRMEWHPDSPILDPLKKYLEQQGPFPPTTETRKKMRKAEAAEAALGEADEIVEGTYFTQIQNHVPLEPHGAMVDPTTSPPEGWVSTQGTFTCVSGIAKGLGVGKDEVAIKCDYVGGGFGSKFGAGREGLLAATLAAKYERPVRVFNDREAEHLDTGNRPGSMQWMRFGVKQDGTITGGFIKSVGIVGGNGGGGGVRYSSNRRQPTRYETGAVARDHSEVTLPIGGPRAFRAPGHPQGAFALESLMDELAEKIGMDPVEFRIRNETSATRKEMLPVGAREIGWKRRKPTGSQTGRLRRGFGVGAADWGNGHGRCDIRMEARPDGLVLVYSGTQDIGTGQRTVLADMAADSLGIDRSLIEVRMADSRYPFGPASGGSMTARATVPAVRATAAKLLEAIPALGGSKPANSNAWRDACSGLPEGGVEVDGSFDLKYWGEGNSDCVQFAEVLVDSETGVVTVERIVAVQACGLAVNRLAAENQIVGGVIQGVSYALFEEKVVDPQLGCQLNPDHSLYKIAGALDTPEIVPLIWEQKGGAGVRSLGEPTTVPTAGAIANAVANALGARVRALPITPARVLEALEEQA